MIDEGVNDKHFKEMRNDGEICVSKYTDLSKGLIVSSW